MKEVLKLTDFNMGGAFVAGPEVESELLCCFEELVWDDPNAFFSLLANCLASSPVEMDQTTEQKLYQLNLIDAQGVSPPEVCSIAETLAEGISRNLACNSSIWLQTAG